MESEHFVGKIAQKALIERDGKVLITQSKGDIHADVWELPGGRLHREEAPAAGLQRELQEELGVGAEIGSVVYVEQYRQTYNNELHLLIAYKAALVDPTKPFMPDPEEVVNMKWIGADEISNQKIFDNCRRALDAYFGVR